jgi:hypothetical protein
MLTCCCMLYMICMLYMLYNRMQTFSCALADMLHEQTHLQALHCCNCLLAVKSLVVVSCFEVFAAEKVLDELCAWIVPASELFAVSAHHQRTISG